MVEANIRRKAQAILAEAIEDDFEYSREYVNDECRYWLRCNAHDLDLYVKMMEYNGQGPRDLEAYQQRTGDTLNEAIKVCGAKAMENEVVKLVDPILGDGEEAAE